MAIQLSTTLRNAIVDAITSTIGASGILEIRTGAQPANCAAASTGTLLATLTFNATFAPGGSSGTITLNAITQDSSADATGTAGHYRAFKLDGTTCVMQGSVTATGGGGDLTLTSTSIVATEAVSITSWTITAPGA